MHVYRGDADTEDAGASPADETTQSDEAWPVAPEWMPLSEANRVDDGDTSSPYEAPPRLAPQAEPPSGERRDPVLILVVAVATALVSLAVAWSLPISDDPGEDAGTTSAAPEQQASQETTAAPRPTNASSNRAALPDVVGLDAAKAQAALVDAGMEVRVRRAPSERPRNQVVAQQPSGDLAPPGATVVLTLSAGSATVIVPRVVGLTPEEARRKLRAAGLLLAQRAAGSTSGAPTVVSQTPGPDEKVEPRSTVVVRVTKPTAKPRKIVTPSLVGLSETAAHARLRDLGLGWTTRRVTSSRPEGTVLGQTPTAGAQLRRGKTVELKVSSGLEQVTIPDVTGLDVQSAQERLASAGLKTKVSDRSTSDPAEDGVVLEQTPVGGETTDAGDTVTIVVARLSG